MFIHGACLLHRLGKRSSLATKHEEEVKGQDFDALDYRFKSACAYVSYVISKISSEDLLYFYARYKQAIFGDAEPSDVPYGWKIKDKAKYEEWRKLTGMTKDEAKRQYVEKLIDLDIGWIPEKASFGYGPRHSILLQPNDTDNDGEIDSELLENRNWYSVLESDDSCKIDNTLQSNKKLLGMRAENELTPLLWAADRGKANAVECLLRHGADLNETDNDGQTALDYAIACSHENVIKILSKYGETNSSEVIEESECCTAQPT